MTRLVAVAEDGPSLGLPRTIKMLGLGKISNVHLAEASLAAVEETAGTWCWHANVASKSSKKFTHNLQ